MKKCAQTYNTLIKFSEESHKKFSIKNIALSIVFIILAFFIKKKS